MFLPENLQENFCLMPWIHIYVATDGKANACCNAPITFGSLRNETISEIWEGEKINTFRASLLRGEKDRRCAICFNKEASGKSSIRTETLDKFKLHIPKVLKGEQFSKPIYLDLRFSNVCNLKCRTCWHGASSSWFEDAKVLKTNLGNKAIIKATTNNSKLIDDVVEYSDELEEIYFAGGEPLLMEEHYRLLDKVIENKFFTTRIRYNTNLSRLNLGNRSAINYWKQLQRVHLSISIDEIGKKVEVIRKGLNWGKLVENIKTIQKECPHVVLEIAPTISVFNIYSIGELHRFFIEKKLISSINAIYLNLLERPNYYNIQLLPMEEKIKVQEILLAHIEWLKTLNVSRLVLLEFESIIIYLFARDDNKSLEIFKAKNKEMNILRNESLNISPF